MHGASNRDTHLYPPHNNSSVHLTTTTYVRDRTFRGLFSNFRKLIDAFHFFLATMEEGSSQVHEPRASHQLNPIVRVVLICMTSIANVSQEPPLKQPRALQTI